MKIKNLLGLVLALVMVGCLPASMCVDEREPLTRAPARVPGELNHTLIIDMESDAEALSLQAYSTQTSAILSAADSSDVDILTLKEWGTSTVTTSTTKHLLELADTTSVMTAGTNSLAALNIDLAIGNSTAGTNSVYGILIDGITADDQNTEAAISIGAGWDTDLDLAGGVDIEGASDYAETVTFSKGSGNAILISAGGAISLPATSDITSNGYVNIGNGTPDGDVTAGTDEQLYVEGNVEVDGILNADGAINADSTLSVALTSDFVGNIADSGGDLTVADNLVVTGTLDVQGGDITMQNDETLSNATNGTITATVDAAGYFAIVAGNLAVGDHSGAGQTLNGVDAYIEGLLEVDGNVYADGDLAVEGTANLDDVDIDLSAAMKIDGHMLDIGGGSYATADGDNDLGVAADLEVDGATDLDGALDVAGATTVVGLTASGDVTVSADTTGGNLGVKNEFIGLPRIKLVGVGAGTNPGSQTISWMDDSADGEWAPVDASVVEANSTTLVKYGTNAYQTTWAADAVATDGFIDAALGGNASWEDMESVGILVRSDTAWAAGDLTLVLTDDGGARTFNIPAITVVDVWTWLEVDITSLDAGTGDIISDVAVLMSSQGESALGAFVAVWDIMWTWDLADEEDLGVEIVQDGVLSVVDQSDGTNLAELTNYIVHYESGSNTHIVWVSNESAQYNLILLAY